MLYSERRSRGWRGSDLAFVAEPVESPQHGRNAYGVLLSFVEQMEDLAEAIPPWHTQDEVSAAEGMLDRVYEYASCHN